jgi:hypothetical protein
MTVLIILFFFCSTGDELNLEAQELYYLSLPGPVTILLFIRQRKKPTNPLIMESINKLWDIYTMEHYNSEIKKSGDIPI